MAYQAGTVANANTLLTTLYSFLGAVSGWTQRGSATAPDVGGDWQIGVSHVIDTVTRYYTLVTRNTTIDRIDLGVSTAYSGATNIYSQTGTPCSSTTLTAKASVPFSSSLNYWFFATDRYCYVVIQIGDYFQYLAFGATVLQGTYQNGIFISGCKSMNSVSNDYTSQPTTNPLTVHYGSSGTATGWFLNDVGTWVKFNEESTTALTACTSHVYDNSTLRVPGYACTNGAGTAGRIGVHPLAITSVLIPALIFVPHTSISNRYTFSGYVEDIYMGASSDLSLPTEVVIGSDTYSTFPLWMLGDTTTLCSLFFKKIT